jgi:hypothetical protein
VRFVWSWGKLTCDPRPSTQVIDLAGRAVIPGLVNANKGTTVTPRPPDSQYNGRSLGPTSLSCLGNVARPNFQAGIGVPRCLHLAKGARFRMA